MGKDLYEPGHPGADDPIIPNWVDSDGNRYWVPDEPDGTAYALDGENAGHWVEFGGSGVRKIMDWRDNESLLFLIDLNERIKAGEEMTEDDRRKVGEILESMKPVFEMLQKFVAEMIETIAAALKELWEAIPPETREVLAKMFPAEERSVGVINKEIRDGVVLLDGSTHQPIGSIISNEQSFPGQGVQLHNQFPPERALTQDVIQEATRKMTREGW